MKTIEKMANLLTVSEMYILVSMYYQNVDR